MYFPELTVLDELKKYIKADISFEDVYLVCVQHLLETTGSLFEAILSIGFCSNNIFVKGKVYSTNAYVENKLRDLGINVFDSMKPDKYGILREVHKKEVVNMWRTFQNRIINKSGFIIILDDGGLTLRHIPEEISKNKKFKIFGIEQTTSGLRFLEKLNFPIVQVATSAAKKYLEPHIIARSLNRKLQKYFNDYKPKQIGVIGFGNIGQSITAFLQDRFPITIFDITSQNMPVGNNVTRAISIEDLIYRCDFIIGATGIDITASINWKTLNVTNKILFSVSSHDIEFNSLIRSEMEFRDKADDVLADLKIKLNNGNSLTLVRGGSVANFDNTRESGKKNEIQLTRGLLFAAIIQIQDIFSHQQDKNIHLKLDSKLQKIIVDTWLKKNPHYTRYYSDSLLEHFDDVEWIEQHS